MNSVFSLHTQNLTSETIRVTSYTGRTTNRPPLQKLIKKSLSYGKWRKNFLHHIAINY